LPFLYNGINKLNIKLGLDLQGGAHLEYKADVSQIDPSKISDAMAGAQDVIERRVNPGGVGETLVQTAKSGSEYHVIVEVPGKDIEQAKKLIQGTPLLEFKEEDPQVQQQIDSQNDQTKKKAQDLLDQINPPAGGGANFEDLAKANSQDPDSKDKGGDLGFIKKPSIYGVAFDNVVFGGTLKPGEVNPNLVETDYGWEIIKFIESQGNGDSLQVHVEHILLAKISLDQYPQLKYSKSTDLTGKNLKSASVEFQQQGVGEPQVAISFDAEGTKIFADLTKRDVGKGVAILLDGLPIVDTNGDGVIDNTDPPYAPIIQTEITDGKAVITGNFTLEKAKELAQRLNTGALPVPLSLIGEQKVEATLGADSLKSILIAGGIGLIAVVIFMLLFYRFLGLVASLALLIYTLLMIAIFKLTGITLTLSGIAGFVLSIGMAVDANILIFERTKEEIRRGRTIPNSLDEGFKRAWTSIRDGNISSLLTAGILYEMGTGFVKGFAASLFIGVVVSMFTAVVITRTMLKFIISDWIHGRVWMVGVRKSDVPSD
jgi:protein-export membrane protein SecD